MRRSLLLAAVGAVVVTSHGLAAINEGDEPSRLSAGRLQAAEVELIPLAHRMMLLLEFELADAWRVPLPGATSAAPQRSPMNALTVYFEVDRAAITPGARRAIENFFDRLESTVEIVVTGHADRSGPEGDNPGLSRRRAEAVKGVLLEKGLQVEAVESLHSDAGGGRALALPATDAIAPLAGRRAVVTILGDASAGLAQCADGRLGPPQAAAAALWHPPCRSSERLQPPTAASPAMATWVLFLRISTPPSSD